MKIMRILVICVLCVMLFGCSNISDKKYELFRKEFIYEYLRLTEQISENNIEDSLKYLNSNKAQEGMERLKILLDDNKNNIPNDKTRIYQEYIKWYNDIESIMSFTDKYWGELTPDDRMHIDAIISNTDARKRDIKKEQEMIELSNSRK